MEFVLNLEDLESAQTEKRVQKVSLDLINEEKFMQALRRIELKMNKEQQSSAWHLGMSSVYISRTWRSFRKLWKNTNAVIYAWMTVISRDLAEAGSPVA